MGGSTGEDKRMSEGERIVDQYDGAPAPKSIMAMAIDRAIQRAIAAEREACARIAETTGRLHPLFADEILQKEIAAAIRARSET